MTSPRNDFSNGAGHRSRSTPIVLLSSRPVQATSDVGSAPPDPEDLRRVQLRRKAILAVVIFAFIGAAAVTQPVSQGTLWKDALATTGLMAICGAILGRAWCSLYIGGRKTREIVMRGPYSVSRNPLYLFSFVAAFGVGAQTGSLTLSLGAVLLTFVVLRQTVRREETWLRATFGAEYDRYLGATPRFWPRWSAWRDEPRLEISPGRFVTTVLDGAVLILAVPVMAILSEAQAEGLLPVLLTLP